MTAHNPAKRLAIYKRDGNACVYCGRPRLGHGKDKSNPMTLDHIIPKSEGGGPAPTNLLTACLNCNTRRGSMSLVEFVGAELAAQLCAQAQLPIAMGPIPVAVEALARPPRLETKPPPYPTSLNNKLHDLVRDLVSTLAYLQPAQAERMKARAVSLGVKFRIEPSGFEGLQDAIDDGRLGGEP